MDIAAKLRESLEHPELQLINIRKFHQPDQALIDDYTNAGILLEQEQRNPLPQKVFDDTKEATVLNLADSGHQNDDHFLSLMHPDTIDRAKMAGFKDIVLEAGDITNMTEMFDEYTHSLAEFAAGQKQVEITLGDEKRTYTEPEYKAHIFGVMRGMLSGGGHLDFEEASRVTRATMDTLEYAASQDIRIHAVGAPIVQTGNFILKWQDDFNKAKSTAPEERTPDQVNLVESFAKREPIVLFIDVMNTASRGKSLPNLSPTELDFTKGATSTLINERVGGATINVVTADTIETILKDRQEEGFTNPKVLHMHGMLHFVGDNDIDELLENKGITTQTIGLSGLSRQDTLLSGIFNMAKDAPDFPQKWYFAPTAQYGDINTMDINSAQSAMEAIEKASQPMNSPVETPSPTYKVQSPPSKNNTPDTIEFQYSR